MITVGRTYQTTRQAANDCRYVHLVYGGMYMISGERLQPT